MERLRQPAVSVAPRFIKQEPSKRLTCAAGLQQGEHCEEGAEDADVVALVVDAERGIGPDATIHLDFALKRLTGVIDKLLVWQKKEPPTAVVVDAKKETQRLHTVIIPEQCALGLTFNRRNWV